MRKSICTLASVAALALFAVGCAGPEQKLGRGLNNTFEIVRGGEFRRTIEQSALWDSPDEGYTTGAVRGLNRTLARTGLGIWEVITFPLPNRENNDYGPLATHYLKPTPVYPDSHKPGLMDDATFNTDTFIGYSGGDIAPMVPGSRFRVFDN